MKKREVGAKKYQHRMGQRTGELGSNSRRGEQSASAFTVNDVIKSLRKLFE